MAVKQFDDLTERRLSREDIFKGRVFGVHVDKVRLPDGRSSTREVIDHCDGVAVLALDQENRVYLVRQYRYVFSRVMLELPAGKLDPGETPAEGAARELKEETGIEPEVLFPLGRFIPSCGCFSERLHLFMARDLKLGDQHLDAGEFLNVELLPFDELYHRCMDGEIEDSKTIIAVLKAKELMQRG